MQKDIGKVARFLSHAICDSGKTQAQIAMEAGFAHANVLTMLKQGKTKLPLQRAPALARALDIQPTDLLKMCLLEYQPEVFAVLDKYVFSAECGAAGRGMNGEGTGH